jgi:hypothetical protein
MADMLKIEALVLQGRPPLCAACVRGCRGDES